MRIHISPLHSLNPCSHHASPPPNFMILSDCVLPCFSSLLFSQPPKFFYGAGSPLGSLFQFYTFLLYCGALLFSIISFRSTQFFGKRRLGMHWCLGNGPALRTGLTHGDLKLFSFFGYCFLSDSSLHLQFEMCHLGCGLIQLHFVFLTFSKSL